MKKFGERKWLTIAIHVAAWMLLFSLPYLLRQPDNRKHEPDADSQFYIILNFAMDGFWVALFYINAFVLIPRMIYKKKQVAYVALHIAVIIIVMLLQLAYFKAFIHNREFNFKGYVFFNIFPYIFMLALSTAYKFSLDRQHADKLMKEKENANLKTELQFLRSQVSPHFMFNVLNNMVALSRKQSALLEPSLIKLSSLLRYMLYEAGEEKVQLEKETEYLQSYIDLQQQRFGKNVEINVVMRAPDKHYEIEPMLLIPFVENAFKHGTGMMEKAVIDINLEANNGVLYFTVKNKYNEETAAVKDKTSGIGLTNVQRRLNLLYHNNHTLGIEKKDGWFTTSLQLKLHVS